MINCRVEFSLFKTNFVLRTTWCFGCINTSWLKLQRFFGLNCLHVFVLLVASGTGPAYDPRECVFTFDFVYPAEEMKYSMEVKVKPFSSWNKISPTKQ